MLRKIRVYFRWVKTFPKIISILRFQNSNTLKFLSLFLSLFSLCAVAQTAVPTFRPDSAHLGVALEVMPGRVLKIDPYERMWLHENKNVSIGVALN